VPLLALALAHHEKIGYFGYFWLPKRQSGPMYDLRSPMVWKTISSLIGQRKIQNLCKLKYPTPCRNNPIRCPIKGTLLETTGGSRGSGPFRL
jgi:hypothetical protein